LDYKKFEKSVGPATSSGDVGEINHADLEGVME
jgi:hypothetical protein